MWLLAQVKWRQILYSCSLSLFIIWCGWLYFRYGWIIRTCLSMSCAWCCTWSSWAWTTKFKTTRRTRFDGLSLSQSCSSTCCILRPVLMVPGTLHWGALPRQLVPWNEPPLQLAPRHQLREGPRPRDSSWGEERGSAQHQYWSVFLWPGKKKPKQPC